MSILDDTKTKMTSTLEHFKNDLKNIRTGRANPGLVEHVTVEIYGSHMRLKDIASISAPESRMLLITPFDSQNAGTIGKAIEKANLGFNPIVEGGSIRIKIPPMTEEIRKKMAKVCHDEREKTKVTIRNIRRDGNEQARKQKVDGEMAEDILKKTEKGIQELTDRFCREADELSEKKEKELSQI